MCRSIVFILLLLGFSQGKPALSEAAVTTPSREQIAVRLYELAERNNPKDAGDSEEDEIRIGGPDPAEVAAKKSPATRNKMKSLADSFIKNSAARLGISEADHASTCDDENSPFAYFKQAEFSSDRRNIPSYDSFPTFNSTDEILPWFASIAPKMNEFFSKRIDLIKKKIGKLDDGAQKYLREVGDSLLTTIVRASQEAVNEKLKQILELSILEFGEKAEALSLASVDSLERHLCFSTSLKIWQAEEELQRKGTRYAFADFEFNPRQYIVGLILTIGPFM